MPDWKLWREMSRGSMRSAEMIARSTEEKFIRSAISRYYYASYQAVTAMLLQSGTNTTPEGREAWSHKETPKLVRKYLRTLIGNRRNLNTVVSNLSYLYKQRIFADYDGRSLSVETLVEVAKEAAFIIKIAEGSLPQLEQKQKVRKK